MKLQEVTAYNLKSQQILNESWDMLTESQRLHVGAWEKHVWPLMEQINLLLEADLTADQIQQIFSNAEKVSVEQGTGLTALGKAGKVTAEVSGKLKAEIDKLLKQAKNSEPVKNMDAQFDKLRSEIATSVKSMQGGDKILAGVDKWKKFAQENPGKSAFIIGAMTSLLAFASGGAMSGAAIGFFLRLANNTIKGDQLSTAVGKAAKTAAIGAVAGAIGGALADNVEIVEPEITNGEVTGNAEVSASVGSEEIAAASDAEPEQIAQSLADMTEEEYKLQMAQKIAEQFEKFGGMSDAMIQKMADDITITGNFPENFQANLDSGTVVRGNIYLSPDELAEWNKFVNADDPFAPNGVLGNETTEWLRNNVEAFPGSGAAADTAADAAADTTADTTSDTATDTATDAGGEAPSADSADAATSEKVTFQGGSGVEYDRAKLVQAAKDAMANSDGPEYLDGEILDAVREEMMRQAEAEGTAPDFAIDDELRTWINAGMNNGEGPFAELQGSSDSQVSDSIYYTDKEAIIESLWDQFDLYEQSVNEGPVADAAKGFAKSVGGVAAAGAKKAGSAALGAAKKGASAAKKEIAQKVTVRKLNSMWKKMGSPTDTGSIAKLLSDAGMSDEQIGTVAQQNKVELPAPKKAQNTDQQASGQAAQGGGQQANGQAAQGGGGVTGAKVDVKSLAAEIKKLPAADVETIKAELTAEVGKATTSKTPQARPQGGGKQKGKLSQTPSAIRRRQATAAKRATDAGLQVTNPASAQSTAQNTQQPAAAKSQPSSKPAPKKVAKKKVTKKTQPQQPAQ